MMQPLCKVLLCFGLIAAVHQAARLAAAPGAQAEIVQASPKLAHQFQRLGRDYRIQIYNTFRLDRLEYDRRRAAWGSIRHSWQSSEGHLDRQQAIIKWLHIAIHNSAAGSMAPLPQLPDFEDKVTRPLTVPSVGSQHLELPRTGQRFSQQRGTIQVAPRSREGDFTKSRQHLTRPAFTPDVSQESRKTKGREPRPAPAIIIEPSPVRLPSPRAARRPTVEPRVDRLPPRSQSVPTLKRRTQPVEPPVKPLLRDNDFAKTILRSSRKLTDNLIPPNHLAETDRRPIRNRRPAPATAIELPPIAPVPPQATEEHAEINLVELAAHIAGYDRGLKTLENRLLLSKRLTPGQLAHDVAELADLARRRETITLYLRLLAPEIRQTLPKLNAPGTATNLLERRIRETRAVLNRGSFPARDKENELDREILDAIGRKLGELARPAGQP